MIFALAGKMGAGKDALVPVFERFGFEVIDADRIGHAALAALQDRVVETFGTAILSQRGTIDRRALGSIVFSDASQLQKLESIVHPWIFDQIQTRIRSSSNSRILINAALIGKLGLHRLCDKVFWVQAPVLTRIRRVRRRDKLPWLKIFQRLWAQRTLSAKDLKSDVDTLIVDNRNSLEAVRKSLEGMLIRMELGSGPNPIRLTTPERTQ